MGIEVFIQFGLPMLGTMIAVAWFLWQRYLALENRLLQVDQKLIQIDHKLTLIRQATESKTEHQDYLINSNTALINHRSSRFFESLKDLEERLFHETDEIKAFLAKTTEFKVRG